MYFIQRYEQFGCFAFDESIQVSAQPVAPSCGIVSFTGTCAACRLLVCSGHEAPMLASPLLKRSTSSEASAQYFLISGFCFFSRSTAAWNCFWLSSYGSLMARLGSFFDRYRAASAIWIGLSGTVTWPLYFGS